MECHLELASRKSRKAVFSWSGGVAVSREKGRESRGTIQKAESEDRKGGC